MKHMINRRNFLTKSIASVYGTYLVISPSTSKAQMAVEFDQNGEPTHNIFSYRHQNWKEHFHDLKKG